MTESEPVDLTLYPVDMDHRLTPAEALAVWKSSWAEELELWPSLGGSRDTGYPGLDPALFRKEL